MKQPAVIDIMQNSLPPGQVNAAVDEYKPFPAATVETRSDHMTRVNDFYDLVTDFYEFGWGESFHFAPMFQGEAFAASIARHEYSLAARLGLSPGMKVLDVGCGVGGPMRAIARFSGATIVGVNNNDYQIKRGNKQNAEARLADRCSFQRADFMNLPIENDTFDAIYAIEATCHAADKLKLFTELARVMKPGTHFAGYEWCMTDKYQPNNAEHRSIKKGIEEGDALPEIWTMPAVIEALERAGLETLESKDVALEADPRTPWYLPLAGRFSFDGFKHTGLGRASTHYVVKALEALKLAPKGSTATSTFLQAAATALVRGGETGIFTPMFYFHVRKPSKVEVEVTCR
jgi:sterol 24-C-methyltransferase